jgi:glycosyltransferase involved in cell wall biosynthesis
VTPGDETTGPARDGPAVSVIIPTRNRWPQMLVTLRGAVRQCGVALEVIVVDDGSDEPAASALAQLDEPGVRVIRHETNRGVAAARNSGIEAARGGWLAFLDDDDLWAPHKLRTQLGMARDEGAVFCYAAALVLDERGAVTGLVPAPPPTGLVLRLLPGNAIPAGASNMVARADVIRDLGGFDEALFQLADWELWIRLSQAGRGAACTEPLLAYIHHPQNMLLTDKRDLTREFEYLAEKHRALCERYGIEFDRGGLARWMAWGASRSGRRVRAAAGYTRAAAMYAARRKRYWTKASLRDAIGALAGERLTDTGRRSSRDVPIAVPDWLDLYRRPEPEGGAVPPPTTAS